MDKKVWEQVRRVVGLVMAAAILLTAAGCGGKGQSGVDDGEGNIDDTPKSWQADAAALAEANRVANKNELLIGCWIPPLPHQTKTQEDADARIAELAESGLNCISTHHGDMSNIKYIKRLNEAAVKYGVKIIIELGTDLSKSGIKTNLQIVKKTMDLEAVIGYNLYDEPLPGQAEALADELSQIRELTGNSKLLLMNMLPNYGNASDMAPQVKEGLTWYQTYLESFMGTGTDVLSFDFYPFSAKQKNDVNRLRSMLENLSDMVLTTKKYNIPAWGFMQDSEWSGMRAPNAEELALLSHLHLIFGFESYSYFLYAEISSDREGNFLGMLTWDNTLTEVYYRVKANNERMRTMGYRCLSYSLKGFLTDKLSYPGYVDVLDASLRLNTGTDTVLKKIEADRDTLVGVFEGRSKEENEAKGYAVDNAATAYYVLNFDAAETDTVTLYFDGLTEYTVWGPDGIEAMGADNELRLTIPAYDAKFVELKTFSGSDN